MRGIDADLLAALESGCTTLARCWLLERRDGATLGFTDHDRALEFDGVVFEPETGFARSELERGLGLGIDNMEAAGALRSEAITEADLQRGLYDGAAIRQWLVDWTAPARRALMYAGNVGEVRRGALGFEVEIEGLAERLNRPHGRVFMRRCDADLGDERCRKVLDGVYAGSGTVTGLRGQRTVTVSGFGQGGGWFSLGKVTWTAGDNAGLTSSVQTHAQSGGVATLTFWKTPPAPMQAGDAFTIVAGCDKTAETCRTKFDNLLNHRGFPYLPGEDWATAYPTDVEVHDGGSLFRG